MKRLLPALVLLLAVVTLAPAGAQAPAKRAMDLEDILASARIGTTALSTNGQWLAYRMSPLQGDSEVILRNTAGDKEMKFPVGEGAGGAVTFSDDSTWAAITSRRRGGRRRPTRARAGRIRPA